MTHGIAWTRHLRLAAVLVAAGFLSADRASAEDLVVEYDQAKLVRLAEPADSVIIGNPSVADVTLKSTTLMVITGKTFGITNLIVLNAEDRIILNERLMVRADEQRVVSLNRGGAVQSFNCIGKCEPIIKVGDEQSYYQTILRSAEQKRKISEGEDAGSSGDVGN
ncbi:MAG: pilus assembly protein N-terminal domain-containing protein [Hyphomicrobiaceae bacterium]